MDLYIVWDFCILPSRKVHLLAHPKSHWMGTTQLSFADCSLIPCTQTILLRVCQTTTATMRLWRNLCGTPPLKTFERHATMRPACIALQQNDGTNPAGGPPHWRMRKGNKGKRETGIFHVWNQNMVSGLSSHFLDFSCLLGCLAYVWSGSCCFCHLGLKTSDGPWMATLGVKDWIQLFECLPCCSTIYANHY